MDRPDEVLLWHILLLSEAGGKVVGGLVGGEKKN